MFCHLITTVADAFVPSSWTTVLTHWIAHTATTWSLPAPQLTVQSKYGTSTLMHQHIATAYTTIIIRLIWFIRIISAWLKFANSKSIIVLKFSPPKLLQHMVAIRYTLYTAIKCTAQNRKITTQKWPAMFTVVEVMTFDEVLAARHHYL